MPVAPLVIDTTTFPDATSFGGKNGFVYRDSNGSVNIASVTITDDGTGTAPRSTKGIGKVHVTLATTPTGTGGTLEYSFQGAASKAAEFRSSAWGNLRDSDNRASLYVPGVTLWNWGLIFKKAVS